MSETIREAVKTELADTPAARLTGVLSGLGIASSTWYRPAVAPEARRRPGPPPRLVAEEVEGWVLAMGQANPWYGYKRIAVMCRRAGQAVTNRDAYRVMKKHGFLQRRRCREAELHQATKRYELLPTRPNALWQMDVTYVHIPGYGWWYAVTVIDYYSRYLLAARLTWRFCATEVIAGLQEARAEAERLHGPLDKPRTRQSPPFLVTDNGSSFLAKRFHAHVKDLYTHVRIRYRTPTQLGLLERFHRTFKDEEIYWRRYDHPGHARDCIAEFRTRYTEVRPHWALIPEAGGDPLTPEDVYVRGGAIQIPKWQSWAKGAKQRLDQLMGQAAMPEAVAS